MLRAKNYQNRPMFHGIIQKITLAQFFLRHGACAHFPLLIVWGYCMPQTINNGKWATIGRLSTRHGGGTSTSQVIGRLHVCRAAGTVTDQWQKLHGSWTATVELRQRNAISFERLKRLAKSEAVSIWLRLRRCVVTFCLIAPATSHIAVKFEL